MKRQVNTVQPTNRRTISLGVGGVLSSLGLLVLMQSAACVGGSSSWPPEQTSIPGLSLEEAQIVARVEGRSVQVTIPLRVSSEEALRGTLILDLVDLQAGAAGDEDRRVDRTSLDFSVEKGERRLLLRLEGLEPGLERRMLSRYLLRYELSVKGRGSKAGARIYGARDLWVALPKTELILLAPDELPAGKTAQLRLIARDPSDGSPLVQAPVTIAYEGPDGSSQTLETERTDARGEAQLTVSVPDRLESGTLIATIEASTRDGTSNTELRTPITLARARSLLISTDKPRYQPGQTMHLRALALDRESHQPAAAHALLFELRDAKGNKVFKKVVQTDTFGIASATLPLAQELNLGSWELSVTVDGLTRTRTVLVERYSLPKFKLKVEPSLAWVQPGDRVQGVVSAFYFFGKPVEGRLELEAQEQHAGKPESVTLLAQVTGTLVDGAYAFALDLPAGLNLEANGSTLGLFARVTDSAGQTVQAATTRPLSRDALVLTLQPATQPVLGLPLELLVAAATPTGQPVAAAIDAGPLGKLQLSDTGVGTLEIASLAPRTLLSIDALGPAGARASASLAIKGALGSGLILRSERSVYRVGETLHLQLLATADAPHVVALDLGHGGRAISLQTMNLVAGRATASIILGPQHAGALTLEASYPGAGGQMLRGSRTVFVDADNALQVEVSAPLKTAPGEPARLQFQVRDEGGQGVPAAIGVAVVDEALLAMGGAGDQAQAASLSFGGAVPAAVAGHAAAEILSGSPQAREDASRLLFASGPQASAFALELNSYRIALSSVRATAQARFTRTAARLQEILQREGDRGLLTQENAASYLPSRVAQSADVYGQALRASSSDGWSYLMEGAGPDEVWGSPDDVSLAFDLWTLIYSNGGGGGWFGAPNAADDGMAAAGGGPQTGAPAPNERGGSGSAGLHIRSYFPETLFVDPALLTDGSGHAELSLQAADSITNWKIAASASSLDGRLGEGRGDLVVFQDFFVDATLPATLTKGDELEVPVAVYNYRDVDLDVRVELQAEPWFNLLGGAVQTVSVPTGAVRGVSFRIRAAGVGPKSLSFAASAGSVQDLVRRSLLVEPGGESVDLGSSGTLRVGTTRQQIHFPANAIDGGNKLIVKLYPGVMAQTVEGMDAILSEPHGCFEQSTSTTWPNVMVANYMKATGGGDPATLAKAQTLVQTGYQMLLGYEASSGGFNWWGDADPGNRILTAIGILILKDMESVIEVDPAVVTRSASWLASQQTADGSWPKGDALHMGNEFLSEDAAIVTAFAVEALAAAGGNPSELARGAAYLEGRVTQGLDAPFTLAAVARSLARMGSPKAGTALAALQSMATLDTAGPTAGLAHWGAPGNQSWSGASGPSAGLETTAIAAQAFLAAGSYPELSSGALGYLASNKDSIGTWGQTQATVQSLRAFTASVTGASVQDVAGQIEVQLDGAPVGSFSVDSFNAELLRSLDLSTLATPGDHQLSLSFTGHGKLMMQVVGVHHLPWTARSAAGTRLELTHGKQQLAIGELDPVQVAVTNQTSNTMDQVLVKVGLAPGMVPTGEALQTLVATGQLSRFERSATGVVLYLAPLAAGERRALAFEVTPTMAGRLEAPASRAYGYYNPDQKAVVAPVVFVIQP